MGTGAQHSALPVDAVLDVLRHLATDADALHRLAVARRRWLTKGDIVDITGFSSRKVDQLIASRTIPMFRAPDSDEWRMTWKQWERCEQDLVREGLLPKNLRPKHSRQAA